MCFWGAERTYWESPGVVTTAVGYANGLTPNPTYQERFEREATVGLTLDHPGVVKVHDLEVDGGHLGRV